jgi:hypothetical protein
MSTSVSYTGLWARTLYQPSCTCGSIELGSSLFAITNVPVVLTGAAWVTPAAAASAITLTRTRTTRPMSPTPFSPC